MALDAQNKIINAASGIVVDGTAVEGGYFVTESTDVTTTGEAGKIPDYACVEGALCYCKGDAKFYQYNGTSWVLANLGDTITKEKIESVLTGNITSHSHELQEHSHGNLNKDGKLAKAGKVVITDSEKNIMASDIDPTDLITESWLEQNYYVKLNSDDGSFSDPYLVRRQL